MAVKTSDLKGVLALGYTEIGGQAFAFIFLGKKFYFLEKLLF